MTDPAKPVRVGALLAITLLLGACDSAGPVAVQPTPELVIPAGVRSTETADQIAQRILTEIAANERLLGRRLAEPRIVRIQLLRAGETYWMRRLDGTGDFGGMSPDGGPGWMVEAVGTFTDVYPGDNQTPSIWGAHGFRRWDDAGSEGYGLIPCGGFEPLPADQREGMCP